MSEQAAAALISEALREIHILKERVETLEKQIRGEVGVSTRGVLDRTAFSHPVE